MPTTKQPEAPSPLSDKDFARIETMVQKLVGELGETLSKGFEEQVSSNVESLAHKQDVLIKKTLVEAVTSCTNAATAAEEMTIEQQGKVIELIEKVKLPDFSHKFQSRMLHAEIMRPEVFVQIYLQFIRSMFELDRTNFLEFIVKSEADESNDHQKLQKKLEQRFGRAVELAHLAYSKFEVFAR